MTREEAIEQLKWYFECDDGGASEPITKQAYKKAIEALEQPEIIRCKECGYYADGHCYMHNTGIYPDDYCSYALKPPHGGKLASMEGSI